MEPTEKKKDKSKRRTRRRKKRSKTRKEDVLVRASSRSRETKKEAKLGRFRPDNLFIFFLIGIVLFIGGLGSLSFSLLTAYLHSYSLSHFSVYRYSDDLFFGTYGAEQSSYGGRRVLVHHHHHHPILPSHSSSSTSVAIKRNSLSLTPLGLFG